MYLALYRYPISLFVYATEGATPLYDLDIFSCYHYCSLIAESTTGVQISIERAAEGGELPEDVGREGALLLLQEIQNSMSLPHDPCLDWS